MKKIKYYAIVEHKTGIEYKQVNGYRLENLPKNCLIDWCIHKNEKGWWIVSDCRTGAYLCQDWFKTIGYAFNYIKTFYEIRSEKGKSDLTVKCSRWYQQHLEAMNNYLHDNPLN